MKKLIKKENITSTRLVPKLGMYTLDNNTPESMFEFLSTNGFADCFKLICITCNNEVCSCKKSIEYNGIDETKVIIAPKKKNKKQDNEQQEEK